MEHLSRGVLLEDTKLLALSSSVAFVLQGYVRVQKAHDSSTIRVIVEDRTTIFYDQTLPHWKISGFAYEKVRNQTIWSGIFLWGTEQERSSCATSVRDEVIKVEKKKMEFEKK